MNVIKRFKFDVAGLALYKFIQVLSTIIITKILLQQFSVDEYAQIIILTTISQFVLIDTGTGDSLKKHILAGEKEVNNLIVNGFCITAVLSLLISFFLYCFTYFIPTTQDVNKNSLIIVFAMSFLVMPFKICQEVLSSYQKHISTLSF
ncbi:hypothetical protein SNB70_17145 [Escherichia coli]|nr:hypothetical protein SNB70_17145 [Escherichia coli]